MVFILDSGKRKAAGHFLELCCTPVRRRRGLPWGATTKAAQAKTATSAKGKTKAKAATSARGAEKRRKSNEPVDEPTRSRKAWKSSIINDLLEWNKPDDDGDVEDDKDQDWSATGWVDYTDYHKKWWDKDGGGDSSGPGGGGLGGGSAVAAA